MDKALKNARKDEKDKIAKLEKELHKEKEESHEYKHKYEKKKKKVHHYKEHFHEEKEKLEKKIKKLEEDLKNIELKWKGEIEIITTKREERTIKLESEIAEWKLKIKETEEKYRDQLRASQKEIETIQASKLEISKSFEVKMQGFFQNEKSFEATITDLQKTVAELKAERDRKESEFNDQVSKLSANDQADASTI